MKKLDVPIVQDKDGNVALVINNTKDSFWLHVMPIVGEKLGSVSQTWRRDEVDPWDGDIIISNCQKRIV